MRRLPPRNPLGTQAACFAAAAVLLAFAATAHAAAPPCQAVTYASVRYTVCTFDISAADVRLYWQKPDGTPYRTFGALAAELAGEGLSLAFAINGGMFQEDLRPVGLFVQNGQVLKPINTANAPATADPVPNFYKKPNGVFLVDHGRAQVLTTDAFVKARPEVQFATQSGPMLVIDGTIHPAFIAGSTDLKQRSGVGVEDPTHVAFVISEGPVNFFDFARFFSDRLGARNALFLDGGSAPGIYVPELGRNDPPGDGGYGPIIAVVGAKGAG